MVTVLKTLDAHVGGAPIRLLIDGFPAPRGASMRAKQTWAARHADHIRRALTLEPRGHRDMLAAVLTEPTSSEAHAGVLFMSADGWEPLSGHGAMSVAVMALDRGTIVPAGGGRSLTLDTVGGCVRVVVEPARPGVAGFNVQFENVPAFVLHGGAVAALASRRVRVDIAFAGMFHAVVDSEALGIPLDGAHLPELRRAAAEIVRAVNATIPVAHPVDIDATEVERVVFTGPARYDVAALRVVMVTAAGRVDPSPSVTGMSAVMAIVDVMGLLDDEQPFVCEGLGGALLAARVKARMLVGDAPALVPEITGSCWMTGEHQFFVSDEDPCRFGFQFSS